jgi:dihydrolipoamide dehydrogenase
LPEQPDVYDVVVIGGGPGGYVAGIRAGQLGLKAAVVEKAPALGGTCLHWGCIPTKAMLHAAEVADTVRNAASFGVQAAAPAIDMAAVHRYKNKVVTKNAKGVEFLFKKNKVEWVRGRGRVAGRGKVEVEAADGARRTLATRHVILATGSAVRDLPFARFDGERILSSDDILGLPEVPKSLAILGAGAVGVEFASVFASLGSKVTVLELLPRAVPLEDEEISAALEKAFRKRGIEVHADTAVSAVDVGKKGVTLKATSKGKDTTFEAERVLLAAGRRPVTDGLGLEGTLVAVEKGFVKVDGFLRTGEEGIYAIGDIVATPLLAHVASHEAITAVEHLAGVNHVEPMNYDQVPACTYCSPEIASVGLSEAEAKRRGHDVRVAKFPFTAIAKAAILGETEGFVKIVGEARHDELLGMHVIGPRATELIAEATVALRLESTVEELFHAVHAHPTLSEAVGEAALGVHGRTIHL